MSPRTFKIEVPESTLSGIMEKVAGYSWHEMPADGGWAYGANLKYMQELCEYWINTYDWRKHEDQLNRWSHFVSTVDGLDIHYIHEKGSGPNPLPLLISHGWPGSVLSLIHISEPTRPERN